jgi:F0F1-type ATP synthase epsilon subunit
MTMTIEIVTPKGVAYETDEIERVVVRRREESHVPGSEVAICSHHAPLLMQTQPCVMRMTRAGAVVERDIEAGVLEVCNDHVILVLT